MGHRLIVDPLPIETPGVLFDMTRLIRSIDRKVATGIDRIDLAIGRELADRFGPRCRFVHHAAGGVAYVPGWLARDVLDTLEARWHGGASLHVPKGLSIWLYAARALGTVAPALSDAAETTYVVASHSGVFRRPGLIDRIDPQGSMVRMVYLHDLIPLEQPEYQTASSVQNFREWLTEAVGGPVQFIVNSRDTGARLMRHAEASGWSVHDPLLRLPRVEFSQSARTAPRPELSALLDEKRPVFLALGTIEPRKNHALLLEIWRAFIRDLAHPPRLLISGRRGWMNRDVFEALDWEEAFDGHIHEFADLTDDEVAYAMSRARALLFPSFAEGLGIPAMEAALYNLPVIASDLPALREAAADGTFFLDPQDKEAWAQTIRSVSAKVT